MHGCWMWALRRSRASGSPEMERERVAHGRKRLERTCASADARQGPMPDLMLFVEKPFTPSRLDDVVQEALRRVRAA